MPKHQTGEDIQATLLRIVTPGMSTSALLRETKKAHPKAKKKEIIEAAFAAIIVIADENIEKARLLQNFALDARVPDEE